MKVSTSSQSALCAITAAALLAACGGSQPPIGVPNHPGNGALIDKIAGAPLATPAYKVSGPLLYVVSSDAGLTPLRIYKANVDNPKPFAQISKDIDTATGACIDGDGTLYVVNESNGPGWVSEYTLGHTKPLRVITKGINTPAHCAIDASGDL